MFPGRRCRVKPRRWTPSVPRGTSGPPPGGARIHRGHVRGPNTTLRAILSRPAGWIESYPTRLPHAARARARRQIGSTHTPDPGCWCAASTRVVHVSPCGDPGPSIGRVARRARPIPLRSIHHLMIRGAASGVPRGTGEGAGGAQGACVPRGTREPPGDPGMLPWQSSGPTLPAPANDQQDRHREGGSRGRRTIALPTRPRCRAAESDDQPLGQPVLDRLPSSSPARAPVQPAPHAPRRRPPPGRTTRRLPRLSSRLSGAVGQWHPAAFTASSAGRARPPRGRRGAEEGGLSRQSGRCPSSRANSSASSLDDVSSMPGGKRAGCSTWNSPSGGGVGRLEQRQRAGRQSEQRSLGGHAVADAGTDRGTDG